MKEIKKSDIVCGYCLNHLAKEVDHHNESICPRCSQDHYKTSRAILEHERMLVEEGYFGHPEMVPVEERKKIEVGDIIKIRGEKHKVKSQ